MFPATPIPTPFPYTTLFRSSATNDCTYDDNGTYTVRARIIDKDGGYTEYTTSVSATNVAPTATLSNNGPKPEATAATVSFRSEEHTSALQSPDQPVCRLLLE